MNSLDTTPFCIYCGLPKPFNPGISGCSGETSIDHRYVKAADRPFEGWDDLRLERRLQRAVRKAKSARGVVLHTRDCPAESYGTDYVYSEKFVKRMNLAAQITKELLLRGKVEGITHGEKMEVDEIAAILLSEIDATLRRFEGKLDPEPWRSK